MMALAALVVLAAVSCARATSSDFLDEFLHAAVVGLGNVSLPSLGRDTMVINTALCTRFAAKDMEVSSFQPPKDQRKLDGIVVVSGLDMSCTLECSVVQHDGQHGGQRVLKDITVDVAIVDASFHLRLRFSGAGDLDSTLPSNTTLEECTSNFVVDPTRVSVKGLSPLETRFATYVVNRVAEYVGPYVVDPLLCGSVTLATKAVSGALAFVPAAIDLLPHDLPWIRWVERSIKPLEANSSIPLAPYSSSLPVKLVAAVVNDVLGARTKHKPHGLVINEMIDARMGGSNIFLDFTDDAGAGYVLVSRSLAHVDVALILTSIALDNLNTFDALAFMAVPDAKYTLNTTVSLRGPFSLLVSLQVAMPNTRAVNFVARMTASELRLSLDVLLALDAKRLSEANTRELMACVLSHALAGLQIPRLSVAGSLDGPTLVAAEGEKDRLPVVLQSFIDVFALKPFAGGIGSLVRGTGDAPSAMARALAWLPPGSLREALHVLFTCSPVSRPPGPFPVNNFVRLAQSRWVALAGLLVNDFIGLDYADFSINRLIDTAAKTISAHYRHALTPPARAGFVHLPGALHLGGHVATVFDSFPPNATLHVTLRDFSAGPLHSIERFQVLKQNLSENAYALDNAVDIGGPITVKVKLTLAMHEVLQHRTDVVDEYAVTLQVATKTVAAVAAAFAARVNFDALATGSVALGDLAGPCIAVVLSPTHAFELLALAGSLGGAAVKVRCLQTCESTAAAETAAQMSAVDLDALLARALPKLEAVLTGRDASYFDGFNVTQGLDWIVHEWRRQCVQDGPPPPHKTRMSKPKWIPSMRWVMAIAAMLQALGFAGTLYRAKAAHRRKRLASAARIEALALEIAETEAADEVLTPERARHLLLQPDASVDSARDTVPASPTLLNSPLARLLQREPSVGHVHALLSGTSQRRDRLYLIGFDKALVSHPSLPLHLRAGVVGLLVLNFVLVVASTFYTMASIEILVHALGDRMQSIPMLRLSLDECIDMMVEGHALLFAAFVGTLSGLLPWMRVSGVLFVWCAPTSALPDARRAVWLSRLEAVGRCVFAQFYLLLFFQATVTEHLAFPGAVIDIETVPQYGLFLFLLASVLSLVLGEISVQCNERACAADEEVISGVAALPFFEVPNDIVGASTAIHPAAVVIWVVWLTSLTLALSVNVINVEFVGFSGFGVYMVTGSKQSSASLGSLTALLVDSDPSHVIASGGLAVMVLVHAVLVVCAPVVECLLYGVALLRPEWSLRVPTRVANHLGSIDVLFATLVVVSLQVHTFFDSVASQLSFLPLWISDWLMRFGASKREAVTFGIRAAVLPWGAVCIIFALATSFVARNALANRGRWLSHWWWSAQDSQVSD